MSVHKLKEFLISLQTTENNVLEYGESEHFMDFLLRLMDSDRNTTNFPNGLGRSWKVDNVLISHEENHKGYILKVFIDQIKVAMFYYNDQNINTGMTIFYKKESLIWQE